MRTLVIHPDDQTTAMLRVLYDRLDDAVVINEPMTPSSNIKELLMDESFQRIMLLGHGTEYGLFGGRKVCGSFDRFDHFIVGSRHVQFLRDREVIGIFCNANQFAERYGLTGLFSGMVISELSEALMFNVPVSGEDEINEHMSRWTSELNNYLRDNWNNLREVPDLMFERIDSIQRPSQLELFNYQSVYYFENGRCIQEERDVRFF